MKIKTVINILNEIRYIRSVLHRFGDSLARGRYYQHMCFRALSLDEPETREKSRLYFDDKTSGSRMESIAKILNKNHFFNNKNKRSTEDYEAFYSANNCDKEREIKLFSFRRNKILTICTSSEEMNKQLSQYSTFGKAYNMPRVTPNDRYENSFEISMIELKEFKEEILALENIAHSTMAYNPVVEELRCESVTDALDFSYEDEEINAYMRKIADRLSQDVSSLQILCCMQHGDLSKENLLYGEGEGRTDFWWIDWEHAYERPFFYDYFFYIVHSAFYGKKEAFECYIKGDSDSVMKEFFSHFGLKYEEQYKFDYLILYLIYFLKERVCLISGLPTLKRYYELIESMEEEIK